MPKACKFIKRESLALVFSCEFCEISKNTFFYRTPPVAAPIQSAVSISVFFESEPTMNDSPYWRFTCSNLDKADSRASFFNAIALGLEWLVESCWKVKILKRYFKNYESGHCKVLLKIDVQEILYAIKWCSKSR